MYTWAPSPWRSPRTLGPGTTSSCCPSPTMHPRGFRASSTRPAWQSRSRCTGWNLRGTGSSNRTLCSSRSSCSSSSRTSSRLRLRETSSSKQVLGALDQKPRGFNQEGNKQSSSHKTPFHSLLNLRDSSRQLNLRGSSRQLNLRGFSRQLNLRGSSPQLSPSSSSHRASSSQDSSPKPSPSSSHSLRLFVQISKIPSSS